MVRATVARSQQATRSLETSLKETSLLSKKTPHNVLEGGHLINWIHPEVPNSTLYKTQQHIKHISENMLLSFVKCCIFCFVHVCSLFMFLNVVPSVLLLCSLCCVFYPVFLCFACLGHHISRTHPHTPMVVEPPCKALAWPSELSLGSVLMEARDWKTDPVINGQLALPPDQQAPLKIDWGIGG